MFDGQIPNPLGIERCLENKWCLTQTQLCFRKTIQFEWNLAQILKLQSTNLGGKRYFKIKSFGIIGKLKILVIVIEGAF